MAFSLHFYYVSDRDRSLLLGFGSLEVGLLDGLLQTTDRLVLASASGFLLDFVERMNLSGEAILRWCPDPIVAEEPGTVERLLDVVRILLQEDRRREHPERRCLVERPTKLSSSAPVSAGRVEGGLVPPHPTLTTPGMKSRADRENVIRVFDSQMRVTAGSAVGGLRAFLGLVKPGSANPAMEEKSEPAVPKVDVVGLVRTVSRVQLGEVTSPFEFVGPTFVEVLTSGPDTLNFRLRVELARVRPRALVRNPEITDCSALIAHGRWTLGPTQLEEIVHEGEPVLVGEAFSGPTDVKDGCNRGENVLDGVNERVVSIPV